MRAGIISYGVYIPRLRIKREEYQRAWGYFSARGVEEKSVASFDEDSITMGVEAAFNALTAVAFNPAALDGIFFGSTSSPYEEKQSASTIATALACKSDIVTVDLTGSTKSGISALLGCLDFVGSGRGKSGLVVASDNSLGNPADPIEHQFGAGAAAMIVSNERLGATVDGVYSVSMEGLGERFRRRGRSHVSGVDLGAYYEKISEDVLISCVKGLMSKTSRSANDYDWFILQGLNDANVVGLSKKLGFEEKKVIPGLTMSKLGDIGSASALLALSKILESSSSGQRVVLCCYGPGAGADAVSLMVEREMKPVLGRGYVDYLARAEYIEYPSYLKIRRFLAED